MLPAAEGLQKQKRRARRYCPFWFLLPLDFCGWAGGGDDAAWDGLTAAGDWE